MLLLLLPLRVSEKDHDHDLYNGRRGGPGRLAARHVRAGVVARVRSATAAATARLVGRLPPRCGAAL